MKTVRRVIGKFSKNGQAAVEYLLLMAIAGAVVLIGFQTLLPRVEGISNRFFDKSFNSIVGKPPALP